MGETAETTAESSATNGVARPDVLPALVLLVGAALVYGAIAFQTVFNGQLSADEVGYLIKSAWYARGLVEPYTAADATAQMPAYFYQLGFWQRLVGLELTSARLLSVGFGIVNGVLLFAICRRLTANTLAAAAAVFIFLATPATAYAFATATPAATVSALHLAAVWLMITSLGRPRVLATVAMGLACVAMYFYRQNMLLSIVVLAPLYVLAIGRQRWLHTAILIATMTLATAAMLFVFPDKLGEYTLRLPVISPLLNKIGLLAPNFTLIDRGTLGGPVMGPALDRLAPGTILDTFLLPYGGTLLAALLLFRLAGCGLKVLWIAPLYFLWLAAAHIVASLGYCSGCMLSYAPTFGGLGALAAALSLAMLAHWARQNAIPAAPCILFGAVFAAAINAFAPGLALQAEARSYPASMIGQALPASGASDVEAMARWVSANTPLREPILVVHSLGQQALPSLPYTVFLADRSMPTQSINLPASRRAVNPTLTALARESVQAAIEEESLWSEATLARWIERDYDTILFQEDRSIDQRLQLAAITARFDLAATTTYRGATILLYRRKAAQ